MAQINKTAVIVLGNQLLENHPAIAANTEATIIMIEAYDLFSKLPYHKHKLILIMASMRNFASELRAQSKKVIYVELQKNTQFKNLLHTTLKDNHFTKIAWMSTSDKQPNKTISIVAQNLGIETAEYNNEQFITPENELKNWFSKSKKPVMDSFYKWQRKRLNILLSNGKPVGGSWSYDQLNRKALPKKITIPPLPKVNANSFNNSAEIINSMFPANIGSVRDFWLPTTRAEAQLWLDNFIKYRLGKFGDYEDAMNAEQPFLFHSVLSPLLNIGLINPQDVLEKANDAFQDGKIPLNSYEGFIRQIIGWREYMYGLYKFHQDKLQSNFFEFTKPLEKWWYTGKTPEGLEPPLKAVLQNTFTYGYNHHIERLMVLGNWFLLNSYHPADVYKWFSSMYVDAYEWVMMPNVFGMSQYADGGFTATKPYISGGNYLQKMGKWWPSTAAAKKSAYTKLYWVFINSHYAKLKNNPRMSLVLAQAKKRTIKQ